MTVNELKYYSSLKVKKYREQENKFLVEGIHLIEECLSSPYRSSIEKILIRNDFDSSDLDISEFESEDISTKDFAKLSDTVNPQGIIAVVNIPQQTYKNISDKIVIALESVNDPGNLGTIIRTAYWFGIKNILISSNSADIYNPKTLRASQGAIFHSDLIHNVNLTDELSKLQKENFSILLTDLDTTNTLSGYSIDKNKKYVLVFGNEANGISAGLKSRSFDKIKIESYSPCESLNLAVSAGILMHSFKSALK